MVAVSEGKVKGVWDEESDVGKLTAYSNWAEEGRRVELDV